VGRIVTGPSPYGPFLPLGRRGPVVALAVLVAGTGVAIVLAVTGPGCPTDRFGPGSGDGRGPDRPLLVDSAEALAAVAACPDRHLRQVADLAAPNPWIPVGGTGSSAFTGSYDGGGHRLTGVRIFLPGAADVGLFGVVDGEVRDLVLADVVVEAGDRAGSVAGRVGPTGRVRSVTVRDAAVSGAADVGGLVGLADPDAVVDGAFEGSVSARGRAQPARSVGRVGAVAPTGGTAGAPPP
jgi:hypothetical protein